jgi:hypothetical protein
MNMMKNSRRIAGLAKLLPSLALAGFTTLRHLLLISAITFCLLGAHQTRAAVLIFEDTYNYTTGAPGDQTNLSTDLAARQAGGTTTSTYTEQTGGTTTTTRDALMTNINGASQLRFRTSNPSSSSSQMAVDLNTNFASNLAGLHYKISLTNLAFTRANTTATDVWFAISVGDSDVTGPNNASADVSALIQAAGSVTKWQDNSNAGSQNSGLSLNYGFATRYALAELHIDETTATNTAWVYFEDMNGNTFTSTPWNITFANTTTRLIELRAHQGATGTDGTDMSVYVDTMRITVIPEPGSGMLLFVAAGVTLLRRKFWK